MIEKFISTTTTSLNISNENQVGIYIVALIFVVVWIYGTWLSAVIGKK